MPVLPRRALGPLGPPHARSPLADRTRGLRESGYRGLIDQDGQALTPEREAELRASGRTIFATLPVDTDDDQPPG